MFDVDTGHVLVIPKRRVDRFELLDADEVADLWCAAQVELSLLYFAEARCSLITEFFRNSVS